MNCEPSPGFDTPEVIAEYQRIVKVTYAGKLFAIQQFLDAHDALLTTQEKVERQKVVMARRLSLIDVMHSRIQRQREIIRGLRADLRKANAGR